MLFIFSVREPLSLRKLDIFHFVSVIKKKEQSEIVSLYDLSDYVSGYMYCVKINPRSINKKHRAGHHYKVQEVPRQKMCLESALKMKLYKQTSGPVLESLPSLESALCRILQACYSAGPNVTVHHEQTINSHQIRSILYTSAFSLFHIQISLPGLDCHFRASLLTPWTV